MPPLVIYHSNCMDGFTAAWVCWLVHPDWEFYPGVHGDLPPTKKVIDREVYLLDFSYKRPVMETIMTWAKETTVLDHHKSAEIELTPLLSEGFNTGTSTNILHGKFDMSKSGARLAWEFFHPVLPPPMLVKFVEDRDLWRFQYPETRDVCAAIFSYDYSFETWNMLRGVCDNGIQLQFLISEGVAIERKHIKDIKELLSTMARRAVIGGHNVPVVNLPYTYSSDAANIMARGEPFAVCFFETKNGVEFSLRSTEHGLDVSEIAKQYGGGGHARAAGFRIPKAQWPKFILKNSTV